ncbi:hypothetical protein DFR35_1412 [Sulfurisoma sediminicola]|uniref:Protein involved in plasmid replication-relaxation n=2 Tax=Sulfurisoma sediminicola TaxID=1381557 RepID=A0A497XDM3_9PROT|nr:MobC family replication-relaxation protein [Sulfurisoma sediminicola]RLJ64766.1 hypothetical protein DFR35_1412 [Sulfurisoma sediminicola]
MEASSPDACNSSCAPLHVGRFLPPQERAARITEKRQALLRFLRKNLYTSAEIAGLLLGISSRQGVHTTLAAMERDELLRRETVEANGRRWTLWGITSHGQAFAFDPDNGEQPESKYFEAGRVGLTVLAHTLDLQRVSILAERAGWTEWLLGDQMEKWHASQSRPDALTTSPSGIRFAIECERTIKTVKRYEVILSDRLQAIKRGQFARCLWLSPTPELSSRLRAIVTGIKDIPVAGTRAQIEDRHLETLMFASYQDFPENVGDQNGISQTQSR